jgi:hypothetical protein
MLAAILQQACNAQSHRLQVPICPTYPIELTRQAQGPPSFCSLASHGFAHPGHSPRAPMDSIKGTDPAYKRDGPGVTNRAVCSFFAWLDGGAIVARVEDGAGRTAIRKCLDVAAARGGLAELRRRRHLARAEGRLYGIGFAAVV